MNFCKETSLVGLWFQAGSDIKAGTKAEFTHLVADQNLWISVIPQNAHAQVTSIAHDKN